MSYKNQLSVVLKSLGLNSKDIKVYICLLQNGAMAPATVGRLTGISRSSCYDILEKLNTEGFIASTKINNKAAFFVDNPKEVLDLLKVKKRNINLQIKLAKDVIENIEHSFKKYKKPKIKMHSGVDGIKQIYNETLTSKDKEILIYFGDRFYPDELEDFILNEYIPKRVEKNISAKVICHTNLLGHLDDVQLRRTKQIETQSKSPRIEVNVFDDKTQFVSYANDEYTGITIEHPEIAKAMKALHGLIWNDEQ